MKKETLNAAIKMAGKINDLVVNEFEEPECDFEICCKALEKHSNEVVSFKISLVNGKSRFFVKTK